MLGVFQKATEALLFFCEKSKGKIDKMKALKLVYFADRMHLRRFGRTILSGDYFGMYHGPVHSEARDVIEKTQLNDPDEESYVEERLRRDDDEVVVAENAGFSRDNPAFSDSEVDVMEEVWQVFGRYHQLKLREITHLYPEWKKKGQTLRRDNKRFRMNLLDFFDNPEPESLDILKNEFGFAGDPFGEDEDVLAYSTEIFKERLVITQ